jgi:glycerol-3-phosphate acyltransferase PlsX
LVEHILNDLTIALDVMGGDKGPLVTIPAAILAIENSQRLHLILCGDENSIKELLSKHNLLAHPQLSIYATTEVVTMDEKPSSALRNKKNSSMRNALDLVKEGKAQACVSAGNTGALFATAHYVLKTLPGVERPALISPLPTHEDNQHVFMLDLGANVFCDSTVLYQFGVMGSVVAEEVDGINRPRVALLNMGEEDIKGSDHIKMAASQLTENESINYVGFIEGNDIFTNKADVIVCDGFVGNVALKTCEGVARLVYEKLKHELSKHFFARFIGKILSSSLKKLFKPLNPDQYNGASLIGLSVL